MSLDFAAAERQSLGGSYREGAVRQLLSGVLRMSPHPEWQLPAAIDWAADPFRDVNWRSQFHMLRWLDPVRRAGADGDKDALAMWIRYARDWVSSNPRHAPAHEWVWSDMVDGIRAINLCLAAPLLRDHSPEDLGWLEETIRDHADHLADPSNLGHANHALHQHEALFVCGRVLGETEYWELAVRRFDALLEEAYDEQGVNAEGAIAYHYNNYLWYERVLKRFDAEGLPRPAAATRHALAPEQIAHATRPDGTFTPIGDTDGGSPRGVRSPYTDYVSSGGSDGEAPADLLKIYDRGYLFARSGWGEMEKNLDEETFFSVSFGASDRVHGHPDGGSLTISSDTVNWVVDPGKYQYGGGVERKYMLDRASHSLVSIDGLRPSKGATVELTRRTVTQRAYDFLFSDDSFAGIDLTRRVIYSRSGDYLVVIDHVRSPEQVTAHQRWQLGEGVDAQITRNRVALRSGQHRALLAFAGTASALDQVTGSTKPFDGWVATGWKKKVPATAVTASKSGTSFRFITVFATGDGTDPTVSSMPVEGAVFSLEVATGRVTEQMIVHPDHVVFPGEVEEDTETSQPSVPELPLAPRPEKGARPAHLDPATRQEIFGLIAEARRAAYGASEAERRQSAGVLGEAARAHGLTQDVDLGVLAAMTDLRQVVRGRIDPAKIQPQRTSLLNWAQDSRWRPTHYPLPVQNHGTEFSLSSRPRAAAIHTVDVGPLVLPIALQPEQGDVLTVLFQGAVDRAKMRLPIFLRWRYQIELGLGPTLALADPTLDLSGAMRLGWYLGTEHDDLTPHLATVIRRAADALGVRHIVLAGSSGGGFAALQVASFLPEAVVVAMSPQTDLRQYSRRLVHSAVEPALGIADISRSSFDPKRLSVLERYAAAGTFPRVELVSNPEDKVHVKRHEGPLRAAFEAAGHGERFSTTEIDLGPGHRSLGNDAYGDLLRTLYSQL